MPPRSRRSHPEELATATTYQAWWFSAAQDIGERAVARIGSMVIHQTARAAQLTPPSGLQLHNIW